jgi:peptidoglycan/LPS O-acetylase OafA/YrhL
MAFSAPHFENRPEILSLTSLRFFAAFEVVLNHIAPQYPFPALAQKILHNGYSAVSFFFVLSGFVLVYAYIDSDDGIMRTSKARFWLSRASRIAPAYYVSIAISAPIILYSLFVVHMVTAQQTTRALLSSALFLQALVPPFFDIWNPPAWSLSVETCFYAAFPFLIGPCFRLSLRSAIICAVLLVAIVSVARFIYFTGTDGELWSAFSCNFPLFHFPAFIVGVLTGRVFLFGQQLSPWQALAVAIAGASGVFLLVLNIPEIQVNAMLAPFFALIICGIASRDGRILAARPLVILGHASYAIYILHWPLRLWWMKLDKITDLGRWPWLDCALYLALVVAASLLTFYLIERPVRAYLLGSTGSRLNH